jgi:hypothetical protein
MKLLAHNYAYWPGMDHDIEEMVRGCGPCATATKQPLKAALHSWPPATKPWERIHIDFAGPHLGRHFLIVVVAYSKYPEVISAPNTTSRQTVACSVNCAPNMRFQRQSSATMGRSLPHTSSKSSARLTPSVTSCHHCTIPSQMVGSNALSTPSSAASLNRGGERC